MAIYKYNTTTGVSTLISNGSSTSFDATKEVLQFQDAKISAASGTVTQSGSALIFNYAGMAFTLTGVTLRKLTTDNVTFADGSHLIVGDNTIDMIGDTLANTLLGGNGNDLLYGMSGDDSLGGGAGNDILNDVSGNDTLNGGTGNDWVDYNGATAGVTVNLGLTGVQNTINAGLDTLISIENLSGSNYHDTLTGNGGNNILNGGLGNDILNGGAGVSDWAYYNTATAGVTVNLGSTALQNTLGAGLDTLKNIENLLGSNYKDTLLGNGVDNALNGGAGNDILRGGAGNDNLNGGGGNDVLSGDAGDDVLNGGAGSSDSAYYNTATTAVTVNLGLTVLQNTFGAGSDTLTNIENLLGSNHNDTLIGNGANNVLNGGTGIDTLNGGDGNDVLKLSDFLGDSVDGGAGTDTLQLSVNSQLKNGTIQNVENVQYTGFTAGVDTITIDFGSISYYSMGILQTIDLTGFSTGDKLKITTTDGKISALYATTSFSVNNFDITQQTTPFSSGSAFSRYTDHIAGAIVLNQSIRLFSHIFQRYDAGSSAWVSTSFTQGSVKIVGLPAAGLTAGQIEFF